MAARTNKRDPRAARTLRRISFVREVKQSFLIICEGVNTEPDYFNAFRLTSANIKAVGQGLNTVGLVQKALRMKEEERKKGREYDQCWVVFDKDDFPDRDFNRGYRYGGSRWHEGGIQQPGFRVLVLAAL